jgi:hypothetical protein
MGTRLLGGVWSWIFVLAAVGVAHHGQAGYLMDQETTLTGTVKEWRWGSPHTWLWLTVPDAQGGAVEYSIESGPPAYMSRALGWDKTTLKAGEKITVLISPARDSPRGGILKRVTLPDGEEYVLRRPGDRR